MMKTTHIQQIVYEGNMACFFLAGNQDHNLALSPTIPQVNYALAKDSIAILKKSNTR